MTKQEIISELSGTMGMSQKTCRQTLDAIIEEIICALEKGDQYSQTGFGTFRSDLSKERTGVNPATGRKMRYPKKQKLRFRLSSAFKKELNE